MLTFREHIEIFRHKDNQAGMLNFLGRKTPEEKVRISRGIADTYPLKYKEPESVYEDFNVTDNVMGLVLGQFIMLEQIITGKSNYKTEAENDLAIAQLILRPKSHTEFDNQDPIQEQENAKNILDYNVQEIYSVVMKFLKDRERVLFQQFAGVFYEIPDDDEEEVDEDRDITPTSEALFQQQWYWYSMVRMLAQEDITKYDEIYMLKMSTVMPEMSFLAQKNKIDAANQRKQQAMSKL